MKKNINNVLKEVLNKVKVKDAEIKNINSSLEDFLRKIKYTIKSLGVKVEVFVGGSFAKKTMIKKDFFEVDIFLRFDKKYSGKTSDLAEKILRQFKKIKVHGSRDYFKILLKKGLLFEIVPVIKIKKSEESENITDLSFFHVNYVRKFPKKVLDEIILVKTFCYANNCYGAESYINGFSGYGIELLVYHYGSFLNLVREMSKIDIKNKVVIDIEKKFKDKNEVLMNINSSKLKSPIILIDSTYRQRNAIAALSNETFLEFQRACKNFLKNPNEGFFEKKTIDFEKIRNNSKINKFDFVLLKTRTDKQEGDIAGSKLLKFYNHLSKDIEKYFYIKRREFLYERGKKAIYSFSVKSKKEIIHKGPEIKDKKNLANFRKKHKKVFFKNGRAYSKEKIEFKLEKFLVNWKRQNKNRMKEMHVLDFKIV